MKKKLLSIICLLLAFVLGALTACETLGSTNEQQQTAVSQKGKLNVLRSDMKVSQEQQMSQIKAEYLLKNNGYKDDDSVVVILALEDDSLIETYNNTLFKTENSVGEYAASPLGIAQAENIFARQSDLISLLQSKKLIQSVEHTYSTILNGIAVTAKYGDLEKLQNVAGVESVILCDTYNLPQTTTEEDKSVIENAVDVYDTGIFNSGSVSYKGDNTAVAILDSGFDCSHSVFQNQPTGELLLTKNDVNQLIVTNVDENGNPLANAVKNTPNLKLSDVYYSDKIPFVYDYADKDPDVFPYDSEHGTHVAGIIGGHDDEITGVAVNTQLVLMKVFPDLQEGAETDDILAALEDAVLLQVDAINMSLGSSCGFTREEDGNKINEVYDRINESGISLITAASNSYSSGFGGEQGNTNFVTNPDSGTVGSPSTYEAALSVASISGTKSRYITATDGNGGNAHTFFFLESNAINGDKNDFFKELGIGEGQSQAYEYVTVPGVGMRINYSAINVKGKIALVRRGDITFEEKAQNAKNAGAIACIIYNNIDGDIYMSMGKSDHIPTISISKDDGTLLAQRSSGKMTINFANQAGPFMSDFSSWGPTPSLELKPDITAHGGNIRSSVPGGGYDELSGTSMASPNLCGIVVLIRQYLKDNYPEKTMQEITVMANQLLMSTATIALNQEGNPYSPRKQGAGLASLKNAVSTNAYITVDGKNRSKLELFDDPDRTGVYTMEFNVVNLSDKAVSYNLDLVGMTESVSTSDNKHVAEKANLLDGTFTATVDGTATNTVQIAANSAAKVTLVYTLTEGDKAKIDSLFPYGMYVEGFVKLVANYDDGVDLSVPFLAFYGDWTEAPMFDKTYYEVESEAHNMAIDDEDKIKADYYATTPYGSYFYNYIIPLGTYLYDIDTSKYDEIPASEDRIAISNVLGTLDGISAVYAGLLRGAKTMTFTVTDKVSGEVVTELVDYNCNKAYSNGGGSIPYFNYLKLNAHKLGLINNRQYEFKMQGLLDYGDGGATSNVRNSFSFDFYLDDESPVIKEVSYEKEYDKSLKKDRYYLTLTVYDNHYVQAINPVVFTYDGQVGYAPLLENPIPVYGERGQDATVRFEITDMLENREFDQLITNGMGFIIEDYALNSGFFVCELPGTAGEFKFTNDGSATGSDKYFINVYENQVIDLTKYLYTADETVDSDKSYLKYLNWTSSNEKVATVKEGLVKCLSKGSATITVTEQMDGLKANIIVNVKTGSPATASSVTDDYSQATVKSLRFSHFETLFAYSRAAQTSEIGSTGDIKFLSSMSKISFYPGESVQLFFDLDPWYATDNYDFEYSTTNETVATVNENGVVTALKKGSATITLKATNKQTGVVSNIMANARLEVKSEFIIENRTLVAYKGLGGEVKIPDDEGILYIGAYAFCLYDTDYTVELPEDDYDANKIPAANTSVTSVIIPYGVEEIQKYAFYNCSGLRSVSIPTSCKFIREYAFYNDAKLNEILCVDNKNTVQENVGLEGTKVIVVGERAFSGCTSLQNVNLSKVLSIGISAFDGCTALQHVDLTALRNTGAQAFRGCSSLSSVVLNEHTKLSKAMFALSGIKSVDIYEKISVPQFCFAKCADLESVNVHNSLVSFEKGAFSECTSLTSFNFVNGATVDVIGSQAFYGSSALERFALPNCNVTLGDNSFLDCSALTSLTFGENTHVTNVSGTVFKGTNLSEFVVDENNPYYSADNQNGLLLNKQGDTVILAATGKDYSSSELVLDYATIGDAAFSGTNVTTITFTRPVVIGNYAFANCPNLTTVNFAEGAGTVIGERAFSNTEALENVNNLDKVKNVGDYAFSFSNLRNATLGENSTIGEGAFFKSKLTEATIGANSTFGLGAFQDCVYLETVNMPESGKVSFGRGCFARDVKLANIDLSKAEGKIDAEAFYGCTSLTKAILTNVTEIGDYAFADCSNLRFVEIPVLQKLGEGAFGRYSEEGGAPAFTAIQLPETLVYMGEGAFLGCEGLTEITIPSQITAVPNYTFAYCVSLGKVNLHQDVQSVGLYAFAGCQSLTDVDLQNVKYFADYAFASAASLQNVDLSNAVEIGNASFASTAIESDVIANNLTKVGDYAFQSARFATFTAPNLQHIGVAAFNGCSYLTEFVFSENLQYVGDQAFLGCASLQNYFAKVDGNKISTGKINDYALLDDGILYTVMPSGNLLLTSVPMAKQIETLVVLENTYRVDFFAGNENENVKKIVLPDTLKLIGNYAFYGYKNLNTVEFKSFTAPALESFYNSKAEVTEEDPGYSLLHKYFDLTGAELCYFNFVDLVGKKTPLNMVLPKNIGIVGYDSIVLEAYFGKAENAIRSDYEARDKNLVDFHEYAKKVEQIKVVTLTDEKLISNALSAFNAIPQNQTTQEQLAVYGYSLEEFRRLGKVVSDAMTQLRELKLANASAAAQQLQAELNALSGNFDIAKLATYKDLASRISKLVPAERILLDLTNFNKVQEGLAQYNANLSAETQGVKQVVDNSYLLAAVATSTALAAVALVILKRLFA